MFIARGRGVRGGPAPWLRQAALTHPGAATCGSRAANGDHSSSCAGLPLEVCFGAMPLQAAEGQPGRPGRGGQGQRRSGQRRSGQARAWLEDAGLMPEE